MTGYQRDSVVTICVRSNTKFPDYAVSEIMLQDGEPIGSVTMAVYHGRTHTEYDYDPLLDASSLWSTETMSFAAVQQLIGELRQSGKGSDGQG